MMHAVILMIHDIKEESIGGGSHKHHKHEEPEKRKKPVIRGLLGLAVLKLLREKRMFGAEIEREIIRRFDLKLPPGLIYVLLKKFEEKGLVKSEWQTEESPPKKVYSLTEKGEKFLKCATEKLRKLEKMLHFLLQD